MSVFNSIYRDIQYVTKRLSLDGTSEILVNEAIEIVANLSKEDFLLNYPVRDIVIAAIYAASRKIGYLSPHFKSKKRMTIELFGTIRG